MQRGGFEIFGARVYFTTTGASGEDIANRVFTVPAIYAKHQRELIAMLAASGFPTNPQVRSLIPSDGQHAEWFRRRKFPAAHQWLFPNN